MIRRSSQFTTTSSSSPRLEFPLPPSASAQSSASSKKSSMISSPRSKRPQTVQMPFPQTNLAYSLEPSPPVSQRREFMREPSWETTRTYSRDRSSRGARESGVSIVVSEAEEGSFEFGGSSLSSSGKSSSGSRFTEQCTRDLERQENGALRVWFSEFAGPIKPESVESLPPSNDDLSTPETPSLSLPSSRTSSPSNEGPSTPPLLFPEPPSPKAQSRSRSKSSSPLSFLPSSDSHHPSTCGLHLFIPRSPLLHRFSTPQLRSPSPNSADASLNDDDDAEWDSWEYLPASDLIPTSRGSQKYAFPIEEESFVKRVVCPRPEVRMRERYRGLREVPPIPVKGVS
ncbi:uncharacterized protein JCM6883_002883 [Sporobolomyces salmoneus]|uniref:uncharacterized protein n=1 Tax=Sporobolomyces salmoneus TaxID=183962 RepID=UPI003177A481